MKLLLDTHIWIWMVLDPTRLSRRVAQVLDDPDQELWLSSISVWELLMLVRKKRLELDEDPIQWALHSLNKLQLREAPVTNEVALETGRILLDNGDPADRFIAASAKVFDLTLVTADEKLIGTSEINILANR